MKFLLVAGIITSSVAGSTLNIPVDIPLKAYLVSLWAVATDTELIDRHHGDAVRKIDKCIKRARGDKNEDAGRLKCDELVKGFERMGLAVKPKM